MDDVERSGRGQHMTTLALVCPAELPQWLLQQADATADLVVHAGNLHRADPHARVAAVTTALSSDRVVAVIPANVGVDPHTAEVWRAAADADKPRAVLVTELGSHSADFEDIAAIAHRVLGDECTVCRLPVFDDDEQVIGTLDLADGSLTTNNHSIPSDRAHRRVAVGPRLRLIEELAAVAEDDAVALRAMSVVHGADPDDPDADEIVWGAAGEIWDVSAPLAAAGVAGALAPVGPGVPGGRELAVLVAMLGVCGSNSSRELSPTLTRRNAWEEPSDGPAAVVLAVKGDWALVSRLYGDSIPTEGLLTLTRTGLRMNDSEPPGSILAPYRAWPVGVVDQQSADGEAPYRWVRLSLLPAIGDILTDRYLWLVDRAEDW